MKEESPWLGERQALKLYSRYQRDLETHVHSIVEGRLPNPRSSGWLVKIDGSRSFLDTLERHAFGDVRKIELLLHAYRNA